MNPDVLRHLRVHGISISTRLLKVVGRNVDPIRVRQEFEMVGIGLSQCERYAAEVVVMAARGNQDTGLPQQPIVEWDCGVEAAHPYGGHVTGELHGLLSK